MGTRSWRGTGYGAHVQDDTLRFNLAFRSEPLSIYGTKLKTDHVSNTVERGGENRHPCRKNLEKIK